MYKSFPIKAYINTVNLLTLIISLLSFLQVISNLNLHYPCSLFFCKYYNLKSVNLNHCFLFCKYYPFKNISFAFFFANIPFLVYCTRLRKHQVQTDIHQHGFYTYLMAIQKQHPFNHFYTYKHVKNPNYTISIAKQSKHSDHQFTYKLHCRQYK